MKKQLLSTWIEAKSNNIENQSLNTDTGTSCTSYAQDKELNSLPLPDQNQQTKVLQNQQSSIVNTNILFGNCKLCFHSFTIAQNEFSFIYPSMI